MPCWLTGHKWKYVHVVHYFDNSYNEPGAKSYTPTKRCENCGTVKTKKWGVYGGGWPTVDQLNGKG